MNLQMYICNMPIISIKIHSFFLDINLTMLNSKINHAVISSEARNLLDSSTYAITFLHADSRCYYFADILGFKGFLASLEMTTCGSFVFFISNLTLSR